MTKLQPKARVEVDKVIKRVGDSNYVLGDVATGTEISSFKHHMDLNFFAVLNFVHPIAKKMV